jgi:glycosyltransferase involved in cell wall biosynthesis
VVVFTTFNNRLEGQRLAPVSGPLAGITIYRVGHEKEYIPKWWKFLDKRARQNKLWDKVAAIPTLIHGCSANEWAWVQNVTKQVLEAWNSEGPFDVLHTRLNHPLSHLAGLQVLKRLPKLAWCAYFSDPWPHHLYPEPYRFTVGPLSRLTLERRLDTILQQAGSSVFPSRQLRDYMLQGRRSQFLAKSFVIPHLTNFWGKVQPANQKPTLTIRHSGFLMKERKIEPLYDGLRRFLTEKPEAKSKIRLEFAGRYSGNILPQPPDDLKDVVHFDSYMPPEAIWEWLQASDVFLLVEAKMKEGIYFPSKLADYLGGNRPILALSPKVGLAADCLKPGGGILVEPDDVAGIGQALARLYQLWLEGQLQELVPSQEQVRLVSPEHVIPLYEQAFEQAMKR